MAVLKRAFRFVARLFAILVLAVSLPAVLIGLGLVVAHSHDHNKPCACPGQSSIGPVAVFTGQVHDVTGNSVIFDVDEVQRGTVTVGEPIEALGVEFAPWRQYRVQVFDIDGHRYISAFHPPETLGLVRPASLESFRALRWHARMAVVAVPLFVLSVAYLLVSSWRQSRVEYRGMFVSGLRRLRRKRRSWRDRLRRGPRAPRPKPGDLPPIRPVAPI